MILKLYYALMRRVVSILVPITRKVGEMHFPFTHKQVTGLDYYAAFQVLKPGMIILTRTYGELTTALIPGRWSHTAIYCPKAGTVVDEVVIEATGKGVHEKDLVSFLCSKDEFVILDPVCLTEAGKLALVEDARQCIGLPYDYEFGSNNQALYCSEVVFSCLIQVLGHEPFVPSKLFGQDTITPTDFSSRPSLFKAILVKDKQGLRNGL